MPGENDWSHNFVEEKKIPGKNDWSHNFVEKKIPGENHKSSNFVEEAKIPGENPQSSNFVEEAKIPGKNHQSSNFVETKIPGENHWSQFCRGNKNNKWKPPISYNVNQSRIFWLLLWRPIINFSKISLKEIIHIHSLKF